MHVRETSLFTGAIPNQVRNSQTYRFVSVPGKNPGSSSRGDNYNNYRRQFWWDSVADPWGNPVMAPSSLATYRLFPPFNVKNQQEILRNIIFPPIANAPHGSGSHRNMSGSAPGGIIGVTTPPDFGMGRSWPREGWGVSLRVIL